MMVTLLRVMLVQVTSLGAVGQCVLIAMIDAPDTFFSESSFGF